MRYAYSVTSALLVGGAAISLETGFPAGAQVAQNDDSHMARVVPRAGAPESFADLTAQLQPAVVNISTRGLPTDSPVEILAIMNTLTGRQHSRRWHSSCSSLFRPVYSPH